MRKLPLSIALATTATLASLAGAQAASADSIAYVKDGSIWLSTADGSRQYQVTDGGGYSAVSQSDDGHLSAVHGDTIAYLDRAGNVLADIKTPVSSGSDPTKQFFGPYDPVISPDGKTVAYTYYYQWIGQDPYCNPSTGCYLKRTYQGTAYTHPTRLTAWDEPGMRRQSGWIHPFWVGNDRTFQSDASIAPNEDLIMNEPGKDEKTGFTRWFAHPTAKGWKDTDMTRSQKKLAGVVGDNSEKIWFAYVQGLPENGGATNYPTQCTYEVNEPKEKFEHVSWSPSGATLAYSDAAGINTVAIPEFGATYGDCGKPTENPKLIIPGGKSPSFGPADVPAARQFPPVKGGDTGGGNTGGGNTGGGNSGGGNAGGNGSGGAGGGIVVGGAGSATGAPKLGKVLASGLPLTVQVQVPGTLTVTVKAKGKTVGTAKKSAGKAGAKVVKVTFSKAARRSLAKSKSVTFSVTASLKPKAGGTSLKQTVKVTVKR